VNFYGILKKMTIKVRKKKKNGKGTRFQYKSLKKILTPQDIKEADKFDLALNKTIKEIEGLLLKHRVVSKKKKKKDPLLVWYTVGKNINKFLKKHPIISGEESIFWDFLYGRSSIIHKGIPINKISRNRNDFRTASLLAKYPYGIVKKVGPWALWREILGYGVFLKDKRILDFIIGELIKFPSTRDNARPFLKAVAGRFKKIDSSVLNDSELSQRLSSIEYK